MLVVSRVPTVCARLVGRPHCQGCQGGVHELRAHSTVVPLLETTLEGFLLLRQGSEYGCTRWLACQPVGMKVTLHLSTWGVPRRLQRERGSGSSYTTRAGGKVRGRAPSQPWSPEKLRSQGEVQGRPGLTTRTTHRVPLRVQRRPLDSVSTVRISVADLAGRR